MVGYKFCEKFVSKGLSSSHELRVLGAEPYPAYDRVHLSEYFGEKDAKDLLMASREWYEENDIKLHIGELVTDIDRSQKRLLTHKGNSYEYDFLILATGSTPFVPPIKGVEKQGVFVYRTLEDLDAILDYGKKIRKEGKLKAGILGGGLLGLEAGKAVLDMGLKPYVIELAESLMPRQLDKGGANLLQEIIEDLGIDVLLGKLTQSIQGDASIEAVEFKDGSTLSLDMLIISAGIRPLDELGRQADLEVGPRGGIVV